MPIKLEYRNSLLKLQQCRSLASLLFVIALACLLVSQPIVAKPQSSISVKIQWQGELIFGEVMTLQMSVFSHFATDNMLVNISLPENVELVKGQSQFRLSLEKRQPQTRELLVIINPQATGNIKAEVRTGGNGKTAFYSVSELSVQKKSVNKTLAPRSATPDFRRIQRNGEWLREYQLPN